MADPDAAMLTAFREWKTEHGRVYSSVEEESIRFEYFREHVRNANAAIARGDVLDHPAASGRPLHYNAFADYSNAEWRRRFPQGGVAGRLKSLVDPLRGSTHAEYARRAQNVPPAPTSKDWRGRAVTAVEDQGNCGSCWSFTTVGAIEGAWALIPNNTGYVQLSMQQLISCDPEDNGCNGGNPASALDWLARGNRPIATLESYPFASSDGRQPPCDMSRATIAPVRVTGWWDVPPNEPAMAAWLAAYGPVSVAVAASSNAWAAYTGGIITRCSAANVDHTVLLVGYGVTSSQQAYWVAKNSWGTRWGEGGFVRIGRGSNECGITTEPVLATVAGGSLSPPASPTTISYTLTADNFPPLAALLIVVAAVCLGIGVVACAVSMCRRKRAAAAAAVQQPGAGMPVDLGPGFVPVAVSRAPGGGGIIYASYAQPPLAAPAYPVQPQPQIGGSYDPGAAAAAAAAAEAEADEAFEEETRRALAASAIDAQRQAAARQDPRRPQQQVPAAHRGISVAMTNVSMPASSGPAWPPQNSAPLYSAADPFPTAPGPTPVYYAGMYPDPTSAPAPAAPLQARPIDFGNAAAMRALAASQNRALGLPVVALPPARPGGGWDPEAQP